MNERRQAAARYALLGLASIPLQGTHEDGSCECGREDCSSPGKHPRIRWAARPAEPPTDEEVLRWWGMWPAAPVGVIIGDRFAVLDVDEHGDGGGLDALYELEQEHGALPETWRALTPSGGLHVWFRVPEGVDVALATLAPGVQLRIGRHVMAMPPAPGRQWEIAPDDAPLADLPAWTTTIAYEAASRPLEIPERIPVDVRHGTLVRIARSMRRRGMRRAAIVAALREVDREQVDHPPGSRVITDAELQGIADWADRQKGDPLAGFANDVPPLLDGDPGPEERPPLEDVPEAEPSPPEGRDKNGSGATKKNSVADSPFMSQGREGEEVWPDPLAPAAFHGPLGRLVRLTEPHTEADPAVLLVTSLIAFGNLIGRRDDGPGLRIEGRLHYCNVNVCIVGRTAKARKGTAVDRTKQAFVLIDENWVRDRTGGGLSTGEGLIAELQALAPDDEELPGVVGRVAPDRRLFVTEAEFGRVLTVMQREGNTLSSVLRDLYDHGDARVRTRKDPLRVRDAHVSVLGQCSADELRRKLIEEHQASGFGNRFLFVASRRARALPLGGGALTEADLRPVATEIDRARQKSAEVGQVALGGSAVALWEAVYGELSDFYEWRNGLFGTLTARAETHTLRLATIYALADCSNVIERVHLEAALAVWSYCEQTVAYVWGQRQENPDAERIRIALKEAGEDGLTRTEIRDLFDRHRGETEIEVALALLRRRLLADVEREMTGERGRPPERWFTREAA